MGKIEEPIEKFTFDKLKGKSLGCPSNILFWNYQQRNVASRIEKMEHSLLMGDYGTGEKVVRQKLPQHTRYKVRVVCLVLYKAFKGEWICALPTLQFFFESLYKRGN